MRSTKYLSGCCTEEYSVSQHLPHRDKGRGGDVMGDVAQWLIVRCDSHDTASEPQRRATMRRAPARRWRVPKFP